MEVVILPTPGDVGRLAADVLADAVSTKPDAVLGLATGSSPLGLYAELAQRADAGTLDLSAVRAFALDEYVGLGADDPQSYASVIREEVVVPLGLDPARVHVPEGTAEDLPAACAEYDRAIADAGGIDVQILGIGANGHIGFNEPTSSFRSRTRIKTLAPQTREDNARFFPSRQDVPRHCLTQGLGTISEASMLLMVAQGTHKAAAVAAAVEGPLSAMCPASLLQLHENALVILDEEAASGLQLADYYRHVYEHRPAWQRHTPRRWDSIQGRP